MEKTELKEVLLSAFPQMVIEEGAQFLVLDIPADESLPYITTLKNALGFDTLSCLTAIDWVTNITVVYILFSREHKQTIAVKVKLEDLINPQIESVSHIWKGAEMLEREVFEMFGVIFKNHPQMKRLFLTDDVVGYPLRKDFVDELNVIEL
ncbi:MAG: NADH-quinone oxidoreductase subunit C [Bacteroidia bacterium]